MRNIFSTFILVGLFMLTACSPTGPAPEQNTLTLINAVDLNAEMVGSIQEFVSAQLNIPMRVLEDDRFASEEDFHTLEKLAEKTRHEMDVIYVVLTAVEGNDQHLVVSQEKRIGLVNTLPLETDQLDLFTRRLERQVMRAAAFCLGLPPTPDPFCVTRDYRSIEDLDRMGRNYSPPWQGRFADEAEKLNLLIKN